MEKAACDFKTPLHTARELFHLIVAAIPKFEKLEKLFGAMVTNLVRHMIEHAMDLHVLPCGQVAIQAWILENDAEPFAGFVLVLLRIEAIKLNGATGRVQQRSQHLDG